jgi:hypothetical protein
MKAPADRINAADDILLPNNDLQTPCRQVDLAHPSNDTKVFRYKHV